MYPGIGNSYTHDSVVSSSYAWINFILMLQCVMLYIPHCIWKSWEGKLMSYLIQDLGDPVLDSMKAIEQRIKLLQYFRNKLCCHNEYFWKYQLYTCIQLIVINAQFFNIRQLVDDCFENFDFIKLWSNSLKPYYARTDELVYKFPSAAMCDYKLGGPTGTIQNIDVLCYLSLGPVHEKVYIILWQVPHITNLNFNNA